MPYIILPVDWAETPWTQSKKTLKSADFDKNRLGNMANCNGSGITLHLMHNFSRHQIDPLEVPISWSF